MTELPRLRAMEVPGGRFLLVLDRVPDVFEDGHPDFKDTETGCVGLLVFNTAVELPSG